MAYNEDSSASGHDEPWIQWFCGLKGHEMFCEVERSYIEDGFNLYGLRACVSNFSDCLDLILDRIGPDDSDDSHLTQSACTLYGLIHARYIITAHGLDAMYNKYAAKDFGTCPLVQCAAQPVLPVGLKDEMGAETVKIFCPKCTQVFHPPPVRSRAGNSSGVDGAAFGTTFPHLFLMTFSNLVPDPLPAESAYVPRVFGFRVHKSAQRRSSSLSLPGALVTTNSTSQTQQQLQPQPQPQQEAQQASAQQQPASAEPSAQQQPPMQEPAEADDRSAPAAGALKKKDNDDESAAAASANLKPLAVEAAGKVATAAAASSFAQAEEVAGNGVEDGEDTNSAKQRSKSSSRANKRKKDGDNCSTATGSTDNAAGGGQQQQQQGGPTFLMETSAKRRRRNNSTA